MNRSTIKPAVARAAAQILLRTNCIHINIHRPFTDPQGNITPLQVNFRGLHTHIDECRRLTDMAADMMAPCNIGLIASAGLQSAPLARQIAEQLQCGAVNLRPARCATWIKPQSFARVIDGPVPAGARTAIFHHTTSEMENLESEISMLRRAGANVTDSFTLLDDALVQPATAPIKHHTLTNWREVLEVAYLSGYGDRVMRASVEQYLKSPATWEAPFGRAANQHFGE